MNAPSKPRANGMAAVAVPDATSCLPALLFVATLSPRSRCCSATHPQPHNHRGPSHQTHMAELAEGIPELARALSVDETASKFRALSLLVYFFSSIRHTDAELALISKATRSRATWPTDVRDGLHRILSTRIGPQVCSECLSLGAMMMSWFGPTWAVPHGDTEGKHAELLLQVVRIEVTMLLEDDIKPEDPNAPRKALDDTQQYTVLSCFEIVERSIEYLSLDSDDAWERLQAQPLARLLDIVRDVVAIAMRFIAREKVRRNTRPMRCHVS